MFISEQIHWMFEELDTDYFVECYARAGYAFNEVCITLMFGA